MRDTPAPPLFMEARQALRTHGPGWWRAWQAEPIDAACRAVPAEALAEWPEVAYWRALAALMQDSAEALPCLEQAHAGHVAAGDAQASAVCAHAALVLCLLDIGAMDRVGTWLERARQTGWPAAPGDDTEGLWLRLGVLARVVLGADVLPEAGLAAAWLRAQLRPLRTQLSPDERLIAAQVLVNYHFVQQQYEQFDLLSTQVEAPEVFGAASALMRGRWLYTVGFAHYQIGGHARAEQAWRQALALADSQPLPSVQLLTTLAMVRLLIDRGRLDEAHAAVESIRPQWGAGRTRQLAEWQQMRARVLLMRGQPVLALATLGEALSLADASGLSAPEQASFLTDRAQMLAALGRVDEACELLQQLAAQHGGRDAEVYTCLRLLLRAWQDHGSDEPASRAALAEALARAQAVRYTMFLRLLPQQAAQLCALALRWQIEPVFVREVVRDRAIAAPAEADAQWPWPLWLQMLGGFALTLDGAPLSQHGKTQHKPLELLRLLTCERSQALGMLAAHQALCAPTAATPKSLDQAKGRHQRGSIESRAVSFVTPRPMALAPEDWSERSRELSRLLGRAGLGDRAAFARLYELSSAHLFGVVLRINRDRAQAEEVLQEVYVNVWRAAQTFDAAQSQPLTWLTSIARNRAIDSLRRKHAEPSLQTSTQAAALGHDSEEERDVYDDVADNAPGPLALLSQASDARALSACMQGLSAQQRQSVALAFYDGLSHAEVAEQMRQPLGTVKSWVRRALLSLKSCLESAVVRDVQAE